MKGEGADSKMPSGSSVILRKGFVAINEIRDSYCSKRLKCSEKLLVQTQYFVSFFQASKKALFREKFDSVRSGQTRVDVQAKN